MKRNPRSKISRQVHAIPLTKICERRYRRSSNALVALHYVLETTRDRAGMDAIVLANEDGLPLATVGPEWRCEELAAYTPFIAGRRPRLRQGPLPRPSAIRPVPIGRSEVFLCSVGGIRPLVDSEMERTARAVARIL